MSDRIAVMSDGRVQQIGTPREIYEAPVNRFVADFIGETNLIEVEVLEVCDGHARIRLPGGQALACPAAPGAAPGAGHISLRPERVSLCPPDSGEIRAQVERQVYLGTDIQLLTRLPDGEPMVVRVQNSDADRLPQPGAAVGLKLEADAARLLAD